MLSDDKLKIGKIYWAEIIDKDSALYGKQFKVIFTGIFFRNIDDRKQKYFLGQLKIYRECREDELNIK